MVEPRVLHVVATRQRRGAETFGVELSAALERDGLSSRCVALHDPGAGGAALDLPVLGAGRYAWATLRALRTAARGADVVVAHGSSTLLACAVALRATGRPFIYVNIGDPDFWAPSGARRARVRLLLGRAAAVAAISPRAAESLRRGFGLPGDRVRVLPNARDPERFRPAGPAARAEARRGLGLRADLPVLAWLGALSEEKRPDLAVEVARLLPDVQVALAGDGPLRGSLDEARHAGAGVRLLGALSDVTVLLAAADAVLLTSDSEGVPGVLIEAGLSGLPVAATDVGYVSDVVVDGVSGRLAPRGDAAALAAASAEALRAGPAWGRAAREHCASAYGLPVVAEAWRALLREVAGVAEQRAGCG